MRFYKLNFNLFITQQRKNSKIKKILTNKIYKNHYFKALFNY